MNDPHIPDDRADEKKSAIVQEAEKITVETTLKDRPTITQIRIAEKLLQPGVTQYEACRSEGYSASTAMTRSTAIINQPGVQTALAEALEKATQKKFKAGMKDTVADTMVAGMGAMKVTKQGKEVTDFTERRKSAETVATFAGMRPAATLEVSPGESYHERIVRLNSEVTSINPYAEEEDN